MGGEEAGGVATNILLVSWLNVELHQRSDLLFLLHGAKHRSTQQQHHLVVHLLVVFILSFFFIPAVETSTKALTQLGQIYKMKSTQREVKAKTPSVHCNLFKTHRMLMI